MYRDQRATEHDTYHDRKDETEQTSDEKAGNHY